MLSSVERWSRQAGAPSSMRAKAEHEQKLKCGQSSRASVNCMWWRWTVREGFLPVLLKWRLRGSQKKRIECSWQKKKICGRKEGKRQKLMLLRKCKFIMAKVMGTSCVLSVLQLWSWARRSPTSSKCPSQQLKIGCLVVAYWPARCAGCLSAGLQCHIGALGLGETLPASRCSPSSFVWHAS